MGLTHPLLAADGILIVEKSTTGTATRTSQAQIEKTRMRSESAGPNGTVIMTFDGTAEVMRTIDMQKKTYTEMTKADVDRMGAQMAGAMAKMQQMQEQMLQAQQEAATEVVEASAGGGMVTVKATGGGEIVGITIDPKAIDPDDPEMLADLVLAAVNEALRSASALMESKMQGMLPGGLGGLGLPGF